MKMNKIYLLYRCNRDIAEDRAAKKTPFKYKHVLFIKLNYKLRRSETYMRESAYS